MIMPSSAAGLLDYRRLVERAWQSVDPAELDRILRSLWATYQAGGTVFIFGNGGSGATAAHFSTDLSKGALGRRGDLPVEPCRSLALTENTGLITAWANDTHFDQIFVGQLRVLARPGDAAFAISASGNSPNVLAGIEQAKRSGLATIGFTGFDGGALAKSVDHSVVVDSEDYGVVEDLHLSLTHVISYWFHDQFLAGRGRPLACSQVSTSADQPDA